MWPVEKNECCEKVELQSQMKEEVPCRVLANLKGVGGV